MYLTVKQICTFLRCIACFYESVTTRRTRVYDHVSAETGILLHRFYMDILSREHKILSRVESKISLHTLKAMYRTMISSLLERYSIHASTHQSYVMLFRTADSIIKVHPKTVYESIRRWGIEYTLNAIKSRAYEVKLVSHEHKLVGRVDIIDRYGPIELKFRTSSNFRSEHMLQVVWYALMDSKSRATILSLPYLQRKSWIMNHEIRKWAISTLNAAKDSLENGKAAKAPHTCTTKEVACQL